MAPDVPAPPASAADRLVHNAFHAAFATATPSDRAALSHATARLPIRVGGAGLSNYFTQRHAHFAGTFLKCWPECRRVCPALREISLAAPAGHHHTAHAFRAAYLHVSNTLDSVNMRHAQLEKTVRHWVDGTQHASYHPTLKKQSLNLPPLADLVSTLQNDESNTPPRFSQASLSSVLTCDMWLDVLQDSHNFDAENADASVPHREATRLISAAQVGGGAWLGALPDTSLKGSVVSSATFTAALQRHLGLYISKLAPALDKRAANGEPVTQHERLGDHYLNDENKTNRHNQGNRALYNAVEAVATSTVQLGDKGDGSPAARAEAKQRYAHYNRDHVPDIIYGNTLIEYKCYTTFATSRALGNGSQQHGGAPSTADGHFIAFGNTEEDLIRKNYGLKQIGTPEQPPYDRTTGEGYVAAANGDYTDALRNGREVILVISEPLGALCSRGVRLLKHLGRLAKRPGHRDGTEYGAARTSTTSFFVHHLSTLSRALATADALTLLNAAASNDFLGTTARTLGNFLPPPLRSAT